MNLWNVSPSSSIWTKLKWGKTSIEQINQSVFEKKNDILTLA